MCADYFLSRHDFVVISTPLKMVSENWYNLIKKCFDNRINLVKCWSDNSNWIEEALSLINSNQKAIFVFVNDSLWGEKGIDLMKF